MYMMDPTSDSFGIDPRRPSQLFLRRETIGACSNDHELQQLLFDECEQLQEDRDALREIFKFREPGDPEKESDPNAHVPVNINRLIWCVPRRAASLRRQPVLAYARALARRRAPGTRGNAFTSTPTNRRTCTRSTSSGR